MAKVLKKMSIKALGCDPTIAREGDNKDGRLVPLALIYGRASGTKSGETDKGVWTALTGSFEGVNIQEGKNPTAETAQAGVVFLPGGISEMIEGALESAGEGGIIEFGVKINAKHDPTSSVGYTYVAENLRPAASTDDLANLRQLLQPQTKLFLGPAPTAEPTPAPAPAQAEATKPAPARKK